jgi:hypothetical protein
METYRVRIGRLVVGKEGKGPEEKREQKGSESEVWFFGLVIVEVELNPGPQVMLAKIDEIESYLKTQEKESKAIQGLLEGHKQEIAEMKKGTEAVCSKFDRLSEVIIEVIRDYDKMKQTLRDWVEQQQQLNSKVRFVEEGQGKNNILIFGLQEEKTKTAWKLLEW